jgi:hypothetical protein
MYLGPHHFQAQSRYFEDSIHFAADSLWFCPFGFLGYELDAGALANGVLKLTHARGVFEDGLPFDMPGSDQLPEPRNLQHAFPPTANAVVTYLAVPERKQRGGNCALEPGSEKNGTRFLAEERPVVDEISGGDEKPIRFGRKNIRFIVEGEATQGWLTLPLARVHRQGANQFSFDTHFVPPILKFSASPALISTSFRKRTLPSRAPLAGSIARLPAYRRSKSPPSGFSIPSTADWRRCGIYIWRRDRIRKNCIAKCYGSGALCVRLGLIRQPPPCRFTNTLICKFVLNRSTSIFASI